MSKSRGNVVNPQEFVDRYGSDALRCFLMFIGPWDQGGPWDSRGIEGIARFLRRAHSLVAGGDASGGEADPKELPRRTARLVKKVTEDLEAFRFNTALASLMEHTNYLLAVKKADIEERRSGKSAMPEDLGKHLTPRQMRDLVEFLASLKEAPKR